MRAMAIEMRASPTRKMSGQNQDTFEQNDALSPPTQKSHYSLALHFYSSTSTFLFLYRPPQNVSE
jgi:hypothetical protein